MAHPAPRTESEVSTTSTATTTVTSKPTDDSCSMPESGGVEDGKEAPARAPGGILPNPLVDGLKESHLNRGVLIPLKTTQEVRQDHTIVQAYITRAPTKSANDVITYVVDPPFLPLPPSFYCGEGRRLWLTGGPG
ncbi:hypothetical protein CDD83_7769 [Cordyceps sp. RAO-2017]|nr:hypothetical protein CDD83_7769 [Cordyceps sp. RAO-2017]